MTTKVLSVTDINALGMPYHGFGTYQASIEEAEESTLAALNVGYRHIDTAEIYQNEVGVGNALKKFLANGSNKRSDLFITTKVFPKLNGIEKGYEGTIDACKSSLQKLGVEYVDLYLIHAPLASKSCRLEQWKALLKLKQDGLAVHIGVSNYNVHHFTEIEDAGLSLPEANQIEIHPLCCQSSVRTYMEKHQIVPIAYSSLAPLSSWRAEETQGGKTTLSKRTSKANELEKIAARYEVSEAQLLLRWALQHRLAILPKSCKLERIESNFDLYGFDISQADMETMDAMDTNTPVAWANAGGGSSFNPMDIE